VNKSELIDAVATRLDGDRKAAVTAVDGLIDEITRALVKGDRVQITGFGTFEKRDRAARIARNPATGATVKVKKTSVPAFKAGATLKAVVSGATKLPRVPAAKAAAPAKKAVVAAKKGVAPAKKGVAPAAKKAVAAKKAPAKKVARKAAR
jgi:DNA-binding protein HU-beta